jgi:hypothetical protein
MNERLLLLMIARASVELNRPLSFERFQPSVAGPGKSYIISSYCHIAICIT